MVILIVAVLAFIIAFVSSMVAIGKRNAISVRIPMLLLSGLATYIGFGSLLLPFLD